MNTNSDEIREMNTNSDEIKENVSKILHGHVFKLLVRVMDTN